ncbi:MAG: response regulator [Bacteroidales bacterium]
MAHRLLLADDSVTIQRVIELTFADEDITVVAVGDGQQAIDRIAAEPPDIVLADIDMPERDGFAVAGFVKQNPELKHIPVILLTGAFDPVDEARVAAAGCDGILAKPFEPQLLINRVKELLAATAASGAPVPPARPVPQSAEAEARPASPASVPGSSLDDYFEQLDAAFSALGTREPSDAPAGAPWPSPAAADAAASPEPEWPAPDELRRSFVPTPEATKRLPDPALATAFSALLSAEQGEPAPALPRAGAPVPFDALVEEATRRVIEAVGTQAVRDQVAAIVADVAERLVREEIEKLKASIS